MKLRMLAVAALVGCGLLLTGCVPPADVVVPVETADAQPVFASDEEALAAAVEAYEAYAAAAHKVRLDGGREPERVAEFVTQRQLEIELESFENLRAQNTKFEGEVTYSNPRLQQWWQDENGFVQVIAYFCSDTSKLQIVRGSERSSPVESAAGLMFEVAFMGDGRGSPLLLVEGVDAWQDTSHCS